MWFLSEGPGREESSRSHDEETKTHGSAQLSQQARAGQVSGVGRRAQSCILGRPASYGCWLILSLGKSLSVSRLNLYLPILVGGVKEGGSELIFAVNLNTVPFLSKVEFFCSLR